MIDLMMFMGVFLLGIGIIWGIVLLILVVLIITKGLKE